MAHTDTLDAAPAASDDEELARFLVHANQYSATRVRASAFSLPRGELALSIYRLDGISEATRWEFGDSRLARVVKGAGLFSPRLVAKAGLTLDRDEFGHPRHASIVDWPPEKEAQKERAMVFGCGGHTGTALERVI